MQKRVLIISTLDTKSAETGYLKNKLESIGLDALIMDISMGGEGLRAGDITPARWPKPEAAASKRFGVPESGPRLLPS